MILVKIHRANQNILAACDRDLLGKRFQEGDLQLEVNEFYRGKETSSDGLKKMMPNADIINLVGEEAVSAGVEQGFVFRENVIRIQGIPHAQAVVIRE